MAGLIIYINLYIILTYIMAGYNKYICYNFKIKHKYVQIFIYFSISITWFLLKSYTLHLIVHKFCVLKKITHVWNNL